MCPVSCNLFSPTVCVHDCLNVDIWSEGQLDDDDADRMSASSNSEVAQFEDIMEHHHSSHVSAGAIHRFYRNVDVDGQGALIHI